MKRLKKRQNSWVSFAAVGCGGGEGQEDEEELGIGDEEKTLKRREMISVGEGRERWMGKLPTFEENFKCAFGDNLFVFRLNYQKSEHLISIVI
jgi:hypothetical protein